MNTMLGTSAGRSRNARVSPWAHHRADIAERDQLAPVGKKDIPVETGPSVSYTAGIMSFMLVVIIGLALSVGLVIVFPYWWLSAVLIVLWILGTWYWSNYPRRRR